MSDALQIYRDAHAAGATILFNNDGKWCKIKNNEPKWDMAYSEYRIAAEPIDGVTYVNFDEDYKSKIFNTFWKAENAFERSDAIVILKITQALTGNTVEALVWR